VNGNRVTIRAKNTWNETTKTFHPVDRAEGDSRALHTGVGSHWNWIWIAPERERHDWRIGFEPSLAGGVRLHKQAARRLAVAPYLRQCRLALKVVFDPVQVHRPARQKKNKKVLL
jgi:hypothetical protein